MNKHWTDKSKGMNNLADRIAGLSPAKRALIELRLEKKGLVVSGEQRIPQREKRSSAPLSFAQQRLWFLNELGTGSAYNIPMAIHLKGLPNIRALEESFNEIIQRHETLRTTFRSAGGDPVQVIAENLSLEMPLIDLSGQPKAEREVEAERLTRDEAMRHFDLAKGPLFSAVLIRLSEEEHILLLTMHHIVSDGWSMGVFTSELAALYRAYCNGEASPLPELPIQYADFAHWQREWLQGEVLENQLSYWRKQLEGFPVLQLPTDHPRPAVQTYRGASQSLLLSATLTEALNALSQTEGATLFMTLLAAFNTLLYRHTGQEDIVVGSPIANRNRVEIEGLIGFFVNSLAMRTDLSGKPTFRELIRRVQGVALGAYEHQDLPFEKLVEELNPERDMSHTPLFQIMFNMISAKDIAVELHNLSVERLFSVESESKFDFTLYVIKIASGIELRLVYNTDLFDSWRMAQMLRQYQMLLASIVSDSDQRISELSLLTEAERHQILVEWNDTAADYPPDKCIHTLFETQAENSPEAVAVIFGDEQLSYHELNCRANQLAHYLQKHGVGSEQVVGICMERSFEMIIGLLAILKAGCAYVALEPDFPGARLSFMLEDTKPGLLLTQERLLEKIPEYSGKVVCLDRDGKLFENEQESNLELITTFEDLAYVTYTSGSTGRPKGILTRHRSVIQNLHALIHNYSLGATDIVLQLSSFSFDASVRDIFGPLLAGARIVVVRNDEAKDPSALVAKIAENHVSCILSIVPSQLTQLVEAGSHERFSFAALRHISAAGEPLPMALCKRVQDVFGCSVVNQYGPTECTMISSYHRVVDLDGNRNIALIGRPIANTKFYILDDHLNPVPVGVGGEAYIGGFGVSHGYLNLPDLTAEKFIPNPFSNEPEARLYKTGDMVRYLPDGTMEFLGRRDFQVKLRGVRIELGEVEATLCLHPSVSEAVVVAREDRPGDKRLVAYVVAAAEESVLSTGVLRAFLQEKLPDYMIPSAFVFLDALPLTANRKVDRRALPAPDRMRPDLEEAFVAPRTQTEELVAGIWSNVLGLERIGVYDSFFELGGHSLLVVQIISRIRELFEVELPLRALFEAPTVAGLTERIEATRRSDEGLQTSPLQAVSRDQDLPLSFSQERLWFLHHLEPGSVAYSMPRSIRLKGVLRKDALQKTYVELARRHETLRTTFDSTDGNPVLRIAAEPNILFDTVDLRHHLPGAKREAEVKRLSEEDARKPFDLRRGPLFRIRLFQLEDEEHVLHFNMHHIISDFWSFGVMAREITALYTAFIKGKPADLPELPVQYADYALWQRQWLQGEALETQLNYWKEKLGGELPVLELPTDRPRPAVQTHRGAIESLALSKELTDALRVMSRREGTTLFMTLLAAFKILLYRLTGQEETTVGTPIAGRNRTELEGLIGFFMNTIVMRTDLSGNPTFRELLGRVRETALEAYAHQDMPFERLVEELSPERDLSRTPLFQIFFNHIVAMGDKVVDPPGLASEAIGGLDRESKFDMTLTFLEGEEGLAGGFEYNTDLFDAERIERMVEHFHTLLEGIVADPDQRISDVQILTDTERKQILVDWNDTVVEYPLDKCIHELFENQVERTPDAAAVILGKQRLTYRELNTRANQLAHYLRLQGVVAESRVGIWMDRSLDMMVALLGTLKAGGVYVPLDPAYPQERLAFMLEDAQAPVLLTREKFLEDLPAYAGHVVCMDKDFEAIAGGSEENPISGISADSAAYVIYTSGSTGTPKGVIGLHRGAVNRLSWMWRVYPFKDSEVCCQKTYLSFVDSVWEIFGPLLKGVPTVIIPEEAVKDPHLLVDNLAAAHVSRIVLVPSLLRVLLDSFGDLQKRLFDLKIWVSSGEEISVELAQRFRQVMPEAKLINLYGSSEVSADVTCYEVADGGLDRCIPIGRPIDNTSIYILDSHLQPVPIGVPGELYIGGVGLARGYLNQPDLTAERFIPSPFGQEKGLFKTGDLGCYLPDGNIEYLGRRDHQVKVRGFRIELGEIESQIKGLEAVSNCAVVLREDQPADQRLTAYYVFKDGQAISEFEVRRQLQAKLPEYMLPQHFVELSSIPLTPNGKVDHRALPEPNKVRQGLSETFIAPRNDLEMQLTKIWESVLDIRSIGVTDNFFELGGHSLLALRVFALIQKRISKDLPLAILFQAPTVEQLAEILSEETRPTPWTSLVPMQTEGSNPPFFCVPEAGSTIYSLSNLVRHLGPKQPFYGLQPLGIDGEHSPHTRIEDMAAHYIEEIKNVQPQGPYLLGGRCFGSQVAFEMAQQLCAQGEEVALLAILGDNFIPAWARKGIEDSNSAFSLAHSFQRTIYYLLHSSLGDVFRTAVSEINIRVNPYLRGTKRVLKAQLLARANYIRKPYPGRVTLFASRWSSSRPTYSKSTLAGLAEGGVDLQKVPRVYDRLLDEPHVQVVAAKLIGCINKVLDERFTTKPYTRQAPFTQARKKNGDSTHLVSGIDNSSRSTYADARPTDHRTRLNFSLVLPCYNEGPHICDNIEEIVRALDAAELEYEIILIDDRSTDKTAQQIRSYLSGQHKRNIRAYFHDANLGRGATVAEGIRRANSTYVGFIDIDLETPPQFIPAALDALMSDTADMVIGNRKRVRPLESPLRLVMSSVYRWLVSRLIKTDSLDTEAGFKFFRRDMILPVLDEVQDSHWFWDTEITVVAQAKGLRIHSLPVTYSRHLTKQSTVRPFHDSWRSFASLLTFAKRHRFDRHAVTHKKKP